ncbi:MAG: hypothetical protein DRR00_33935 [Candidatus Parabeggiatoa sp. nov. 3]|nr:MAG: hypothetical protein DRR00_33935 [Gammaproteobacteria bacterium]
MVNCLLTHRKHNIAECLYYNIFRTIYFEVQKMIYERLKTMSVLLKAFLLISLALVVLGCSNDKDDEIRVGVMQPSESKIFSFDKKAPSCFTIDDDYLTSAYAEFEEIDTNNLFGVIISSGIKSQFHAKVLRAKLLREMQNASASRNHSDRNSDTRHTSC